MSEEQSEGGLPPLGGLARETGDDASAEDAAGNAYNPGFGGGDDRPRRRRGRRGGRRRGGGEGRGNFRDDRPDNRGNYTPGDYERSASFEPPAEGAGEVAPGNDFPPEDFAPRGDFVPRGDFQPRGEFQQRGDRGGRGGRGRYRDRDRGGRGDRGPRRDRGNRGDRYGAPRPYAPSPPGIVNVLDIDTTPGGFELDTTPKEARETPREAPRETRPVTPPQASAPSFTPREPVNPPPAYPPPPSAPPPPPSVADQGLTPEKKKSGWWSKITGS